MAEDTVTPEILVFYMSKLLCLRALILFNNPPYELKALNLVLSSRKLLAFIFKFLSDSTNGIFKLSTIYLGTLKSPPPESMPNPNVGFCLSLLPIISCEMRFLVEFAWRGTRSEVCYTICLFCKIG